MLKEKVVGSTSHPTSQRLHTNEYLFALTCKLSSVGQSEGLLIPRSSVRFRLKAGTQIHKDFSST